MASISLDEKASSSSSRSFHPPKQGVGVGYKNVTAMMKNANKMINYLKTKPPPPQSSDESSSSEDEAPPTPPPSNPVSSSSSSSDDEDFTDRNTKESIERSKRGGRRKLARTKREQILFNKVFAVADRFPDAKIYQILQEKRIDYSADDDIVTLKTRLCDCIIKLPKPIRNINAYAKTNNGPMKKREMEEQRRMLKFGQPMRDDDEAIEEQDQITHIPTVKTRKPRVVRAQINNVLLCVNEPMKLKKVAIPKDRKRGEKLEYMTLNEFLVDYDFYLKHLSDKENLKKMMKGKRKVYCDVTYHVDACIQSEKLNLNYVDASRTNTIEAIKRLLLERTNKNLHDKIQFCEDNKMEVGAVLVKATSHLIGRLTWALINIAQTRCGTSTIVDRDFECLVKNHTVLAQDFEKIDTLSTVVNTKLLTTERIYRIAIQHLYANLKNDDNSPLTIENVNDVLRALFAGNCSVRSLYHFSMKESVRQSIRFMILRFYYYIADMIINEANVDEESDTVMITMDWLREHYRGTYFSDFETFKFIMYTVGFKDETSMRELHITSTIERALLLTDKFMEKQPLLDEENIPTPAMKRVMDKMRKSPKKMRLNEEHLNLE